jgi:hypothetical protein
MYQSIKAHLTGVAPLIINNGHLANPLNPFSKDIKRITDKRKMTEADHAEKAKLEWYGSLYLDDAGHICLPDFVVEATLINAAKKTNQGPVAKAGIIVNGQFPLEYDGPSGIDELWESGISTFTIGARPQGRSTVMRTRPKFDDWSVSIEAQFDDEQLNRSDMERFIITAGRVIGFGNWRPRYGRFEVNIIP